MGDLIRRRLRDAVFGTQDGLISTLGALTGIAEGTQDRMTVVISGLVIVTVESLSMAAGSYLSSKSHREYLQRLLNEEKESILKNPEEERKELRAMYRERGYTESEVAIIERRLFSDDRLLLEDMAHKELGIFRVAMPVSMVATVCVLFALGGVKGWLVRQSWWRSGLEMLAVAGLAAVAGFLVGRATRGV